MRGTSRIIEYLTRKRTKRGHFSDWTWKELTDKVKYSPICHEFTRGNVESSTLGEYKSDVRNNDLRDYTAQISTDNHSRVIPNSKKSSARPSPRVSLPTENERFMVKEESAASVGTRPWTPEGRSLTLSIALAGYNGMAFTPWVTLPGEKTPDVHRPFRPN
ncbi:hypothetical protein AVEN_185732-1 [Araneus ventricosus]|uniref:Uncharacterized protein n=1 Tax=Araneus ventricosus TaxID=182803 RepID=A0A4Y2I0W5_ARAVE|nr:hypothetical protein AVEN_185732-1 [Araneus ventricosus]